jgi:hypothetical protein
MGPWPLALCLALYVVQAVLFWQHGMRGLAIAHVGYALGNVGMVMAWYESG